MAFGALQVSVAHAVGANPRTRFMKCASDFGDAEGATDAGDGEGATGAGDGEGATGAGLGTSTGRASSASTGRPSVFASVWLRRDESVASRTSRFHSSPRSLELSDSSEASCASLG